MPGLLKPAVKDSQIMNQTVSYPQCRGRVSVASELEARLHFCGTIGLKSLFCVDFLKSWLLWFPL